MSGNTLNDGVVTNYVWDGESQLKSAAGVTYSYGGQGRRAAKVGSKFYWYGSGGEILAETNASGATTNEYIFFGGKRIALLPAAGAAQFYAEDLLGSSRVVTTNTGTVCYDADFYPYGGERTPYTNTCTQNAYKFEGKERDAETGNDDFGARYYSNRFGRWLSADWSNVPAPVPYANLANPQTRNLYSMVADDPESFADLDGHAGWDCEPNSEKQKAALSYAEAITWDLPVDDKFWARLHKHFSEPELVEIGYFIALTMGQQRWLRTLNIEHHQVLAGTDGSMAPGFKTEEELKRSKEQADYWAKKPAQPQAAQ